MFTNISENSGVFVNTVQEFPQRSSIYSINKCEDQVIGFEFVEKQLNSQTQCCSNSLVHLCAPIIVSSNIPLENVEFYATDDPCFKDWVVIKKDTPSVEIQRDVNNNATGILVRFFNHETCCYPTQMGFKLYGIDVNDCKYSIARGLLIFK